MRFLVDMPLSPTLADWLSKEGHEATHASQMGLGRAPDQEILKTAIAEGRVLITADLDFPRLFAYMKVEGPGLILLRGGNLSEADAIDWVRRVLRNVFIAELPKLVVVVDAERIRKRPLPLP